ncbi:MAG: hypothetical protein E4H14_18950 [Candidatus Thorarchaeota archaeon]|nr:MAG: hypothetical protein E4H14_18950 [Candidatus Thorarchaeota archaeon]
MAEDGEVTSEPLVVKFEKEIEKRHPFTLPLILMATGFGLFFIFFFMSLNDILTNHPGLDPFALLDYPLEIDYYTVTVLFFLLILILMFAVYIVALIPMTLVIILGSKSMFAFGLSQDIAELGMKFGGIQMVLRSLLPGLFSIGVGLGGLQYILPLTNTPVAEWPLSFTLGMALFYGAIGSVFGMIFFPATWFADDSGLVIQGKLKTPYREPPKVDGAGNWLRSVFAGLTVFLYPFTMIQAFILTPYFTGTLSLLDLVIGLFVIVIGLPLVMMGINLPFVMLTEKLQPRVIKGIRYIAQKMGAKKIRFVEPDIIDDDIGDEEMQSPS